MISCDHIPSIPTLLLLLLVLVLEFWMGKRRPLGAGSVVGLLVELGILAACLIQIWRNRDEYRN